MHIRIGVFSVIFLLLIFTLLMIIGFLLIGDFYYFNTISLKMQYLKKVYQSKDNYFDSIRKTLLANNKSIAYDLNNLTPERPVQGMCFIPQTPPLESQGVNTYADRRTYSSFPRPDFCKNCFPYIYRRVISPTVCDGLESLKLLIVITTVPNESRKRNLIRKSWGKASENKTRTIFLFGVGWSKEEQEAIRQESVEHKDILQDNYVDSYFNLSMKVLSSFHWWKKNCQQAEFILRTAADNVINMPKLQETLELKVDWPPKMHGKVLYNEGPHRDPRSKYYVSPSECPHGNYPHFTVGTAFVLPAKTVKVILNTFMDVPFFVLEDIYFSYVMQHAYSVKYPELAKIYGSEYNLPSGHFSIPVDNYALNCNLQPGWITYYGVESWEDMKKMLECLK